jgi:hypothetical protein
MTTKQKRSVRDRRLDKLAVKVANALDGSSPSEGIIVMAALICICIRCIKPDIGERTKSMNKIIEIMKEGILSDLD